MQHSDLKSDHVSKKLGTQSKSVAFLSLEPVTNLTVKAPALLLTLFYVRMAQPSPGRQQDYTVIISNSISYDSHFHMGDMPSCFIDSAGMKPSFKHREVYDLCEINKISADLNICRVNEENLMFLP